MQIKFLDNLTTVTQSNSRLNIAKSNLKQVFDEGYKNLLTGTENINLFGKRINIRDPIGSRTSLEVLPTYQCNAHCKFCIADMHASSGRDLNDEDIATFTSTVIDEYKKNELNFDMRVTGGEPFFFPDRLKKILAVIAKNKVNAFRVNTNGSLVKKTTNLEMLKYYAENEPFLLDISRHHYSDSLNDEAFGKQTISSEDLAELNHQLRQKVMLRAILMNGKLDSLDKVKGYLDHFRRLGFKIFSFKNIAEFLPEGTSVGNKHHFVRANEVDFLDIVNNASKDSDFEFKNQFVESDNVRELYNYKGSIVKFSYLDTAQAKKLAALEQEIGERVLRRGVAFPDGRFSTDWDKEINTIYNHPSSHQKS